MTTLARLRLFHAGLAILAVAAYATGEAGIIHSWLGYGVAVLITLRLAWAAAGEAQLGLAKFYPHFDGLTFGNIATHPAISRSLLGGIALCLVGVTVTGLWMDKGRDLGWNSSNAGITRAAVDDDNHEEDGGEEALEESHEAFANALAVFVGLHVLYLLSFKRPLALFMLFIQAPRRRRQG